MAIGSGGFESWDGSAWSVVTSAVPTPLAVSCASATYCLAVGTSGSAETWDGSTWTTIPSPDTAPGVTLVGDAVLSLVSCPAVSLCEAAGYADVPFNSPPYHLILQAPWVANWDGSSWTAGGPYDPFLNPLNNNEVTSLSCASSSYCVTVLDNSVVDVNGSFTQPAANEVNSISCLSDLTCVEVGQLADQVDIETYSGSTWTEDTTPSLSSNASAMLGVSCVSEAFCAAVGDDDWPTTYLKTSLIETTGSMPAPNFPAGMTLTAAVNPAPTGPVMYSVNVTGSPEPTGSVTVTDGRGGTCSGTLSAGSMSCSIVENAAQSPYLISAVYSGDANYSSDAAGTSESVVPATPGIVVTPYPALGPAPTGPIYTAPNGPVFYIVDVVGGGAMATGTMSVSDGAGGTCSYTISPGNGGCAITEAVSATPYDITATYSGDANYTAASGSTTELVEQAPSITSADSATAVAGSPFSFTVTTFSPTATPIIKAATRLPSGLSLVDNHNGTATISGTPSLRDLGSYTATISATVRGRTTGTQSVVVTVDNSGVFKSKDKYTDTPGGAFSFPVTTADIYPVPTITASPLPAGVTLTDNHNGTGILVEPGPVDNGGVYVFTITADNGVVAPVHQIFTLTLDQTPAITPIGDTTITAGVAMTPIPVIATGYPAPKLTASGLPYGVKLTTNPGPAQISGTTRTTVAGTYPVTITASNKAGTTSQTFDLVVDP
jgi:hypothetical protein